MVGKVLELFFSQIKGLVCYLFKLVLISLHLLLKSECKYLFVKDVYGLLFLIRG